MFFPLFHIIINKFIARGLGQLLMTSTQVCYHFIAALTRLFYTVTGTTFKYFYDSLLFHLVLKYQAKIPSADQFLVKRIQGPGLSSKYFKVIDSDFALVMLGYELEKMEMAAYRDQINQKINKPLNNLLQFNENFNCLGLKTDLSNEKFETFKRTQRELKKRLNKIEEQYWQEHIIKGHLTATNCIKMDRTNLSMAITRGVELCKKFVPEKIVSFRRGETKLFLGISRFGEI